MGAVDEAEAALVGALLGAARARSAAGDTRGALAHRFRALQLAPGRTDILRGAAADYDALGDADAATACRRGTVPDAADRAHYLADAVRTLVAGDDPEVVHHRVEPAAPVSLSAPARGGRGADGAPLPPFRRPRTAPTDDVVDVVAGGAVWFDGFNTLATTASGRWIERQARGNVALALTAAAARPVRRLPGTACFLDARSAPLYYHWLLDVLPRVGLVERAGLDLDAIDHWIVRADSGFARRTLAHLGVPLERVVALDGPERVAAGTMVLPLLKNDVGDRPATALGLGMNPWVPTWLRERFVPDAPGREPDASARIYVSRATRGARSVTDEPALRAGLEARGFVAVEPERLDALGQAALFGAADTVVAPHGGGLANLAFCAPGTRVVELFGDYVVPCYWALAALAGLRYAQYLSAADGNGTADRDAGIDVDVDAFLGWLDDHLETGADDGGGTCPEVPDAA